MRLAPARDSDRARADDATSDRRQVRDAGACAETGRGRRESLLSSSSLWLTSSVLKLVRLGERRRDRLGVCVELLRPLVAAFFLPV